MTPDRWNRLRSLYDVALDTPPEQRQSVLSSNPAADPELVDEVLRMIARGEAAGDLLHNSGARQLRQELLSPRPLIQPGDLISGRYRVDRLVGSGGMGEVYAATDLDNQPSLVALKTLRPESLGDENAHRRLRREALLASKISHPNVCRIFEVVPHEQDGVETSIIVMEYLDGPTLQAYLKQPAPLPFSEAEDLLRQCAAALASAHAQGVIHRDFKPSNVILVGARAVVTDFGLATPSLQFPPAGPSLSTLTATGQLLGTPEYMAPEQLRNHETTERSDIYSLGVVAFELFTRQRPTGTATGIASILDRLLEPAPSPRTINPAISRRWEAIILRCLERTPSRRFRRVAELLAAISSPWFIPYIPPPSRRQLLAAGTVATAAAAAFGYREFVQKPAQSKALRAAAGTPLLALPLRNQTGVADYDIHSQLLERQLQQSPHLLLVERGRFAALLERMAAKTDAPPTPEAIREAALRANVPFVLYTELGRAAQGFAIQAKLERIGSSSPRPIATEQKEFPAANAAAIPEALHLASLWVREQVGESANELREFDRLPEDVTTRSWQALLDYARGERELKQEQPEKAILAFKEAITQDPDFALAWMRVGDTSFSLTRQAEGLVAWQKAMDLIPAGRLTKPEEFRIRGNFYGDTWDFAKSVEVYEAFSSYYPYSFPALRFRAAPLLRIGRAQESIDVLQQAFRLNPSATLTHVSLALHHAAAGQFPQAWESIESARKVHAQWAGRMGSIVAFLAGDYERIEAELDRAANPSLWPWQSTIQRMRAYFLSERGEWDKALSILESAVTLDDQKGLLAEKFAKEVSIATLWFRLNEHARAITLLSSLLPIAKDLELHSKVISLLARNGAVEEATRWFSVLPSTPDVTSIRVNRLIAQGELALARGYLERGEQCMREASGLLPTIWSREFLAYALLRAGKRDEGISVLSKSAENKSAFILSRTSPLPGSWGDLLVSLLNNSPDRSVAAVQCRNELAKLRPNQIPKSN